MKCKHCQTINDDNATYCRVCGKFLRSIIDLYPEFYFRPTSNFLLKGNKSWWFAIIPLSLLFLIGIFYVGLSIDEGLAGGDSEFVIIGGSAGLLGAIVSNIFLIKCYKKTKSTKIKNIADYIEEIPKNGRYPIIVKDGLWGLYDTSHRKIQIACQYDFLKWERNGSILRATKDNVDFFIDIYNTKLK